MKIAIMQPYIFPYIGYFQLVKAVDVFVFYDDVNFIKRGWVNRNNILTNNQSSLFSIPLIKASQNKMISEVDLGYDDKWLNKFYLTLEHSYKKAPYYNDVLILIKKVFNKENRTIADLAIASVELTSQYLGLSTKFELSSVSYQLSKGMDKADRLISICKEKGAGSYINPSGGKELYDKPYFQQKGVELFFIANRIGPYKQLNEDFVGGLSIIDVLMFNSVDEANQLLKQYELV